MAPVSEDDVQRVHDGPGKLLQADCLCPICLEIFLEPVTLPCTHTFCKACFLETVNKANMCCPLCRKRVSTWARHNCRKNTLVNMELWRRIQEAFPAQCQRRLSGLDEDDMNAIIPKPRVSVPGELRREYEDQICKFVEEKRALEEAERKASEEYIQRLLAEEEQRVVEERRRQEERLQDDERLAQMLSKELNPIHVLESQRDIKQNNATSDKTKKSTFGHIEKFLCPMPYGQPHRETTTASTFLASEETVLNAPLTRLPCSAGPCSLDSSASSSCDAPGSSCSDAARREQLSHTAEGTSFSYKRKMEDADLAGKADPHKKPYGSAHGELALQEETMWSRWQQEAEDRQLALRLQRELDRESSVDRRKGSVDSYLLRQKSSPPPSTSASLGQESEAGCASAPPAAVRVPRRRAGGEKAGKRASAWSEGKTPEERQTSTQWWASSACSPQSSTRQKQATLTQLFPNPSS